MIVPPGAVGIGVRIRAWANPFASQRAGRRILVANEGEQARAPSNPVGGVIVYDVTDPANAAGVSYVPPQPGATTDLGPEVLTVIAADRNPTGTPLPVSANEVANGGAVVYAALPQGFTQEVGFYRELARREPGGGRHGRDRVHLSRSSAATARWAPSPSPPRSQAAARTRPTGPTGPTSPVPRPCP
ncbi:hypothetical protein [Methylorubrum sp. Q1]|uniref:hypothetical protein n=1 Tax=Methylorubrum sp. Q1 TaxID=2562453 RepID=UPI001FDF0E61|nr:hypothetical protein [Methylorubrum sp. Q1]